MMLATKLLFVANAEIPSLQLSFFFPLEIRPATEECALLTEQELKTGLGKNAGGPEGEAWIYNRLTAISPELIVFCRYSGPHAPVIVKWARARGVPTIFHLDDDLLNVPIELGAAKHAMHNHPDRLATVRYLLNETTLVYCSTSPLLHRLFGEAPPERALAGAIYCAHTVHAEPTTDRSQVVGYMGFDHAHDFTLALPALVRLLDARPELPFEMFGSVPIPEELKRFGDRIRVIEPVRSYPDFVAKLASLGWTIGICPLAKTPFNEVKADTKWVEYTASGFATIASRGTVYDACCADGCGLLVDGDEEWFKAFEHLLDDVDAHHAQVVRAQERLRQKYSPERLAEQILAVFVRAQQLAGVRETAAPVVLDTTDSVADLYNRTSDRIFFVANSIVESLQISFLSPLQKRIDQNLSSVDFLTEKDIIRATRGTRADKDASNFIVDRLNSFNPTLIVLCRYSGPQAQQIVEWARAHAVPTVFHIDDDLMNVPIELGADKYEIHNHPDRTGTIRYLLDNSTLAYCSTTPLLRRFFGETPPERAIAGAVYCVHSVRVEPTTDRPKVIGYMGSGSHAHDFTLALPALVRILDARSDLRFEMFGAVPIPEELKRFGDRIRVIEPVRSSYPDFVAKLATLGWTIGICPLAKTPFNEVKADTKWVEYTACGFATIASRGMAYDACCADGCGLLVEGETEWFEAFERLLDDADAHRTQVKRAQDKLRSRYSPERLVEQVLTVFARAHELAGVQETPALVAPDKEVASPSSQCQMYIDTINNDRVIGWVWSPRDRDSAEELPLEIWCGQVRLGWCMRRVPRPDVDTHVGDASHAKGFDLPIGSLYALHRLLGAAPALHPALRLAGETLSLPGFSAHVNDLAAFRTLWTAEGRRSLHVEDLWWANSRLLKIRARGGKSQATQNRATNLRAYQVLRGPDGSPTLVQVDEHVLSDHAAIYPVGVRSPYMPLLLVGCTQNGEVGFVDLLPFPSLLRGGLHETEVSALGDEGGSLSDLRRLSDAYLTECVGGENHPPAFALAGLDIDLAAIIGTEPIFDPSLRDWLAMVPQIPVTATNAEVRIARDLGDRSFTDYAATQLEQPSGAAARQGQLRLTLASAAVPTIAGLVSRQALAADAAFAPHLVTDPAAPTKRWFVALPNGGSLTAATELGRLARSTFPSLQGSLDGQGGLTPDPNADRLMPLAIVFRNLSRPAHADLAFPVPRDQPVILPELGTGPAPRVSVLVMVEDPERDLRPLLASLASQVAPGAHEVIVGAVAHDWKLGPFQTALNEFMPTGGQLVTNLDGIRTGAALNAVAARATGDVLIFLDQSVVLHDPRTLVTLARLAAADGSGTVGCLHVKSAKPGELQYALKSAGLFPGPCDFAGPTALALKELQHLALLPRTIYPVVANPLSCMAVSAQVWRDVGGLNTQSTLPVHADLALAVRLAEAGRTNLCTTLLSVYSEDTAPSRRGLDVFGATRFGLWRLLPAIRASTLVKSF